MVDPVVVDIPHKLGRAEAKRRLTAGIGRFTTILPGSSVTANRWQGDTLTLGIEAFGQRATAIMTVFDDRVHATIELPLFLAAAGDRIRQLFAETGRKLLR